MTRGRLVFLLLSLAIVLPLIAGAVVARPGASPEGDSLFKYLSVFTDVLGLVQQAYVDETEVGRLMDGAMEGFTDALDPFAVYVPAGVVGTFREALAAETRPSGLLLVRERGLVYVAGVERGSPGEEAGFQRGDLISRVAGESTRDLPIWEVWRRLAPRPDGEVIGLEVVRLGETRQVELPRRAYSPTVVTTSVEDGERVVAVQAFTDQTRDALAAVLTDPETSAPRMILDLRGVAGGQAAAAFQVAELFVAGELGALQGQDGVRQQFTAAAGSKWSGRLVTMIDHGTLGPAEILATILSQAGVATLVGEPSFGHAGESELIEVSSGAAIYLTTAFYTGQDRVPLSHPVSPDVRLEFAPRSFADRETSVDQRFIKTALEVLRQGDAQSLDKAA